MLSRLRPQDAALFLEIAVKYLTRFGCWVYHGFNQSGRIFGDCSCPLTHCVLRGGCWDTELAGQAVRLGFFLCSGRRVNKPVSRCSIFLSHISAANDKPCAAAGFG